MKIRIILLALLCTAGFGLLSFHLSNQPPRERVVIQNFYRHRHEFEQLRLMLTEDDNLQIVATWGVVIAGSSVAKVPPEGGLPAPRYQRYLDLLKAAHAESAGQAAGPPPRMCLGMWSAGFAGDTRHVAVCNLTEAPANEVARLDAFHKSLKPRHPVYRHIEDNWYLWADW